jgi:hypothetical protein
MLAHDREAALGAEIKALFAKYSDEVVKNDDLKKEIERLRADLARALEDRARFPDRPDDIGHMIEAHIGNLKHGKEEADRHATAAMIRAGATVERLRAALKPFAAIGLWRDTYPDAKFDRVMTCPCMVKQIKAARAALGREQRGEGK